MNLPPSITPEIYQRAVMFATDWRPGQRRFCHTCAQVARQGNPWNIDLCPHGNDIPLPPLTDDLLMTMLRKLHAISAGITGSTEPLDAAIILAAASMEPTK